MGMERCEGTPPAGAVVADWCGGEAVGLDPGSSLLSAERMYQSELSALRCFTGGPDWLTPKELAIN